MWQKTTLTLQNNFTGGMCHTTHLPPGGNCGPRDRKRTQTTIFSPYVRPPPQPSTTRRVARAGPASPCPLSKCWWTRTPLDLHDTQRPSLHPLSSVRPSSRCPIHNTITLRAAITTSRHQDLIVSPLIETEFKLCL